MGKDITANLFPQTYNGEHPLLAHNEQWVQATKQENSKVFTPLAVAKHNPHTFFLGCSDARYNESCLGFKQGDVFTVKTVANVFQENDLSTQAALEYAVHCLGVKDIVVCGHTDCGGINTCILGQRQALEKPSQQCGTLYKYLEDIQELFDGVHNLAGEEETDLLALGKKLAILNVKRQIAKLQELPTMKSAGPEINFYGLIYNVDTGLVDKIELDDTVANKQI
ncbi:carbonate dehydratase NCE103 KNAG_0A05260 [Huiozyma naganishii CBS 8797]|uniref:Carbonic anhydrase n=1 Tax=Huiozyma naganishii (strain ATCC MYA-139 / BCRC 22969 / CBS 8797 / KCTC 17520 / NBRC 10181 / NCYC 3082 / Yp74L-3) TaxID=1071383 RepID=J7RTU4_HUIN7|nr:hypothetical protein KNAG_0A05260 [Kazachstania naganishii CBS 8797]CCK68192.1 hypothetical protein KNAG_0A05260 [Kazachstania naganishii CBS 8797]